MHASYPWNVTLTGLSSSSGTLLVLRLNASFTPHAWTPRDLGFSLLITGVWSGIHLTWPSSVAWVTDVRCHIALTLRHLGSRVSRDPGPRRSWTQLMWPTITSAQRRPRTGRYNKIYFELSNSEANPKYILDNVTRRFKNMKTLSILT